MCSPPLCPIQCYDYKHVIMAGQLLLKSIFRSNSQFNLFVWNCPLIPSLFIAKNINYCGTIVEYQLIISVRVLSILSFVLSIQAYHCLSLWQHATTLLSSFAISFKIRNVGLQYFFLVIVFIIHWYMNFRISLWFSSKISACILLGITLNYRSNL